MRGKNCWCLGIVLILFCSFVSASSVRINEVELNPIGTDSGNEWVELYSEENTNLTNWSIRNNDGDVINLTDFNSSIFGFLIINFSGLWLDNIDEKVILLYNNSIVNETLIFADNTNNNLTWSYCNGNWLFVNSTRGYLNDCPNETEVQNATEVKACDWKIEILLEDYVFEKGTDVNWTVKVSKSYGDKANVSVRGYVKDMLSDWKMDYAPWTREDITNYRNQKYSPNLWEDKFYEIFYNITELSCNDSYYNNNFDNKFIIVLPKQLSTNYSYIKINELLPNPQGYDDATMPEGEWVELYNIGSEDLDLEGLGLKDDYGSDADIYISNSNTLDGTIIKANNYLVVYMNGRFGFLNNDGFERISLYKEDYLIDEVSYSGSTEGLSWNKLNNLWIQSIPSPGKENSGNGSLKSSNITIETIYDLGKDDIAKFGQTIRVKFKVFNIEDYSKVIRSWVESEEGNKVSKEAKFETPEKFSEGVVTIPIQLVPNCDKKFSDGEYKLIIDGLGEREEENIEIADITEDLCEKIKIETIKESSTLKSSESNINKITGEIIYEDKGEKQKRSALYFFCALMLFVVIYYAYGREQING